MSGESMVYVAFGVLACFMGYSIFRDMLPLWGFLLGGYIAFILFPSIVKSQADSLLYQGVAFGIGGVIGAIIATPLYYVIIFLSGAALGMVFGVMLGSLIDVGGINSVKQMMSFLSMTFPPVPQTITQFAAMIVLGGITGGVSINFQKFMIIASSSFLGAFSMATGLSATLSRLSATAMGRGAVMLISVLIIGLIGMFVQFRLSGDT
jgi:hypothetical protein